MSCQSDSCMYEGMSPELAASTAKHPCYSFEAHHQYARMHLPVAPACNISCNYCNRKFDCVNESRPGVTSEVLSPEEALEKFLWVKREMPNLSVVGIAGPGDALANWPAVSKTLRAIRAVDEKVVFCVSTNGLMLPTYADELLELGVRHITVTMNALDPAVGAKLYRHVLYENKVLRGEEAAKRLLENQQAGIAKLTAAGALVKVNTVMVPGVNEAHIPEVVKKARDLGAFVSNIMPLIPAPGSAFEHLPQTNRRDLDALRERCQIDLRQMRHCQQCRADAIGLLTQDESSKYRLHEQPVQPVAVAAGVYRIAVTSKYQKLVDLHYGHAEQFHIYQVRGKQMKFLETRPSLRYCRGQDVCEEDDLHKGSLVQLLSDCDAVLTMRIGQGAKARLQQAGIVSVESCNSVDEGLLFAAECLRQKRAM